MTHSDFSKTQIALLDAGKLLHDLDLNKFVEEIVERWMTSSLDEEKRLMALRDLAKAAIQFRNAHHNCDAVWRETAVLPNERVSEP